MTIKKKCPNCKKKVTVLWHQIRGIRSLIEKDNKQYYRAQCPDCGWRWNVEKE